MKEIDEQFQTFHNGFFHNFPFVTIFLQGKRKDDKYGVFISKIIDDSMFEKS